MQSEAPCLDIRSPGEYNKAHVPGAISFPLFTDSERELVGTNYKEDGQKAAIKLGLEIVGPKMKRFIEQAEMLKSGTFRMYCWRGGMRSSSMAWLFEQYGFEVIQLKGGYKSYRHALFALLEQPLKLKVLTGYTGSGKTEVLHEMQKLGAQVVDLEGLANHPGSSFGNVLELKQPSTEMFQNLILSEISSFDLDRPIWIEDESICIGKVHLPEKLYYKMRESPRYLMKVPIERRIELLVRQYGGIGKSRLRKAVEGIQKKLGSERAEEATDAIEKSELAYAAKILLTYYDRQYEKSIKEAVKIEVGSLSMVNAADLIIKNYGS